MEPAATAPLQPHLLTMLTSLTGAVAHELRTPLSVIQNELQYFESLIDPAECQRSKRSCNRLATTIAQTTLPAPGPMRALSCCDLASVVPDVVLSRDTLPQTGMVLCYPELLQWTFTKFLHFLHQQGQAARYYLQSAAGLITVRTASDPGTEIHPRASLTEYWKEKTGNTSCIPPLVELVLHAQGIQATACNADQETQCIFSIPLRGNTPCDYSVHYD